MGTKVSCVNTKNPGPMGQGLMIKNGIVVRVLLPVGRGVIFFY